MSISVTLRPLLIMVFVPQSCWKIPVHFCLSKNAKLILTAQVGILRIFDIEPGTVSVENTHETVAAMGGPEKVQLAPGAGENVVAGTSASPIAEHCALVMLRIPSLVRFEFQCYLDRCTTYYTDRSHYKFEVCRKLLHLQSKQG